MTDQTTRYVLEIDLPEGYLSIECDVEFGETAKLHFFLNQSSVDKEKYLEENSSEFKERVLDQGDYETTTERNDIKEFLTDFCKSEFGAASDILIRDIDLD